MTAGCPLDKTGLISSSKRRRLFFELLYLLLRVLYSVPIYGAVVSPPHLQICKLGRSSIP